MVNGKVKKVLTAALAVIMIGIFPVASLAADLVLASGISDAGSGWDWDGSTLDLNGVSFDGMSEDFNGIILPAGAVIRLGSGSVNSVSNGIIGHGGLAITGDGELNVTGMRPVNDTGFPGPAVYSVGPLELVGCNVRAQGFFGIGTSNGGIRIVNSRVDAEALVGIYADFDTLFSGTGAEFGIEIVNSTVRSWGDVPILGSGISLIGCQIVDPDGAYVGSFDHHGTAILDSHGNPFIDYVEIAPPRPVEQYTVSYHPNGAAGTAPMDMNRYYRGDEVILLTGEGMSWPGYEFAGWELADGTPVAEPFIMGESDVTLFATWKAK